MQVANTFGDLPPGKDSRLSLWRRLDFGCACAYAFDQRYFGLL